jgi:alanine racemase
VQYLVTDSRRISFPGTSLFIALHTSLRDGHTYIREAYNRGVRHFIVQQVSVPPGLTDANFILVSNTLQALQQLAARHREQFTCPVIGITGSNGKTIVKEWLYQLLQTDYAIVRNPRSYNSQIGVPLSVWQMNATHTLGIFEAGISRPGEMQALTEVIQPVLGILTNLGEAHNEGFAGMEEKLQQKMLLFKNVQVLFCNTDDERVAIAARNSGLTLFTAGHAADATLHITGITKAGNATHIEAVYNNSSRQITIPFTDTASVQNAITCWSVLLHIGIADTVIVQRMLLLQAVDMRLQMVQAVNGCALINDSYSFDLTSFAIALEFLQQQQQYHSKTVILSDLPAHAPADTYQAVAQMLAQKQVTRIITIGPVWQQMVAMLTVLPVKVEQYAGTQVFLQQLTTNHFRNEAILLKGARVFAFEQIVTALAKKVHQTVMEINLTALTHNLKQYQQRLQPGTRLMAMVKAFGYGSGSAEVANVLQFHKVDYLAVAYADEGVDLRKAGISLPILVLNVDEAAFETIVQYNLEPELFSFPILEAFLHFLQQQALEQYPVHLKLDTGMHRLGFEEQDLPALQALLQRHLQQIVVKSVFSHLASSEDATDDWFSQLQATRFNNCCQLLQDTLGYPFIKHLSNSAAIFRLPELQFDMVRLGIGLYGVDSANSHQLSLQTVATLKTTIAQLRNVKAGETIGYNRRGLLTRDSVIATLRIGYADGYSRQLGNGKGKVWIKGQLAPIIGTVCMDMMMVDVTDIPGITEAEPVEVFGPHLPVQQVAAWCGTIAYEILTVVGQRVKRVYIEE